MVEQPARSHRIPLAVVTVLVLAVIVRLVYLYEYYHLPDWYQLTVDNYYHLHWAQSIAAGNLFGDTTYFRAPFYVFVLAALIAVFGTSLWVFRIFGILVGTASVLMTYFIGNRLFNHRAGLLAALLQALYPIMIYFDGELLLDPLFTLLVQLGVYFFLAWIRSRSDRHILLSGLMFGVAAITRPTVLVLVVVVLVAIAISRAALIKRAGQLSLFLLGLVVFIGPVFLRNVLVADDPVLISSQGGINFYIGNNPSADGVSAVMPPPLGHNWRIEDITWEAEKAVGGRLRPGEVSSYWFDRGLEWVKSHPGDFIKLYLRKLYLNFSDREISNNRSLPVFMRQVPLLRYDPLSFWIIFSFAVLGVILAFRKHRGMVLTVAMVLSYVVVTSLFFYNSRFRLLLMPYYIIFAASAPFALIEEMYRHRLRVVLLLALGIVVSIFTLAPVVNVSQEVSTQDLLSKGLMQINRGEYRKAVDTYRIALAYNPGYPTTNLNLGISFMRLGQTDSAFYYLNRERELHPKRARAYINLASLYLVNDQYEQALNEAEHALRLRPYDVTANMVLLRAAAQSPQISDSSLIILVDRSAQNTNNDLFVLNEAATALLSRGLTDRAETILLLAVNAKPPPIETDNTAFDADFRNSPENFAKEKAKTFYQLGYLNGVQGYFADAVKYSRDAIALDSNLVEAYINLTGGLASLGEWMLADSVLATAERRFPDDTRIDRLRETFRRIR